MENIFDNGNIKISDDVLATIATIAVSEVDGVHGMGGSFTGDIVERLSKKSMTKGVKITVENNDVTLDLSVILKYGVRIPEIAWNIQENVKKSVESMSGLNVVKVNVRVVGIEVETDNGKDAQNTDDKKTDTPDEEK